jgi:hypothetical protein
MTLQKVALFCMALLLQLTVLAQETGSVEMADTMRQNGKIYVVVAVILTIFAGIIIYLVRLDRKISRLEKENKLTIHKP